MHWHRSLDEVPHDLPTVYIAHEFLDALPVHQFQKTERGWCERLIDVASDDSPLHFRLVLSPRPTPASKLLVDRRLGALPFDQSKACLQQAVCLQLMGRFHLQLLQECPALQSSLLHLLLALSLHPSLTHSLIHSISQSVYQSSKCYQSSKQSINQSINQAISQTIIFSHLLIYRSIDPSANQLTVSKVLSIGLIRILNIQ